ncbi:aromatic ring-hydroxylating oxygenase subunit alpha [Sphingosinicella soli]|uniref:Phenylpropionate dioxygenase-like ring-hydroxylating dioxygenase large terminal subunit n=1 Tax=Sphingosinicella soli TaxID=333708 RepID=A0A7W7F6I6_9SPHN|nr:aromatic ring-hydroxylating dioxygenase subunit alpha [Sphingosinicella soli]MBB4632391.1 phenylpropionate dioxygenase-like ring-hydroxylating dioxygenase large terminal subunit [Sphingosinicella soli]
MTEDSYDFRRTWPVNPDAPEDSHEVKAPFVDNGTAIISKDRYYSAEWMEKEWRHLWSKVWVWAAREEDIPEPGDFVVFELRRESIVIVRGEDGAIRAFFNVCPHRGNRVVYDSEGSLASGFTCSFHNWRFNLDGSLKAVTDPETFRPEVLCSKLDLSAVRCETWDGFIFINLDENAGPLLDQLGPLPDHARPYRLKDMRIVRRARSVWDANWKVGVDGFNEAYHVHAIHPEILPIFNDYHTQIDLYPSGMSRMVTKFAYESPRIGAEDGGFNEGLKALMREVGLDPDDFTGRMEDIRPAIQKAKRARADKLGLDYSQFIDNQLTDDWNYFLFPNLQMGIHPEGVSFLYFRPHKTDPRKFIFDVIVMVHPQDDPEIQPPAYMGLPEGWDISGRTPPLVEEIDPREGGLGLVFDQDSSLFPLVQEGIESSGYRGAVLSEQEQRIRHFHAELDRRLAID